MTTQMTNKARHVNFKLTQQLLKYAAYELDDDKIEYIAARFTTEQPITEQIPYCFKNVLSGAWPSEIGIIDPNEKLVFNFYETYKMSVDRISRLDLSKIRHLFCAEECGYHVDNTFMEYLCGFRKIEEIIIPDEYHLITRLPSPYLINLRRLFICNDRNVSISDADLKLFGKNLEILELSHNNTISDAGLKNVAGIRILKLWNNKQITNEGLRSCAKLEEVALSKNPLLDRGVLLYLPGLKLEID